MAHVMRNFVDAHRAQVRQTNAKPIFDDLEAWLHAQLPSISGKSPLATAIRYALTRVTRLRPYIDHGILELDANALRLLSGPCEWSQSGAKTTHSSNHRPAAAPPLSPTPWSKPSN